MTVPLFATSLAAHTDRLSARLAEVVADGRYILGPEVAAFEREFAEFIGVEHCVGVANGTDALAIALRALGVRPGEEVVCPAYTFYATAEAIAAIGAVPVFCDIDVETGCLTADTVRPVLTATTAAIVPVHLFGNVAPIGDLREFGVPVLEDAAQAAGGSLDGVRAGALGDAATFSFFPSKNLPCLGDGGAITTDSDEVAQLARRLRFHGSDDKQTFVEVGYNSRLDELQAAALRLLLPELEGWNAARRAAAGLYAAAGLGDYVELPVPVAGAEHVYHLYVVRTPDPDGLAARLNERGVGARRYYAEPLHRQPALRRWGAGIDLPRTDAAATTGLALPMGPELGSDGVREVVQACASGLT